MNFNKYKRLKKRLDVSLEDFSLNEHLKKLSIKKPKSLGRVNGTITMRHRGGGLKQSHRNL
jgi:ribosomal protein L2